MNNETIEVAWRYHNGTKHPRGNLMNPWHVFDPAGQPMLFKLYTDLEPIPLSLDKKPVGAPALAAISGHLTFPAKEQSPDITTLTRILYFSAGITKIIRYPGGEIPFRAAACTGALYHIDLYLVCGSLSGLEAGVYHFDPAELALRQLRPGDYRRILIEASGHEPDVATAPAILVYTDTFWRNACKYQAREYRHAFWDCGVILANTLAVSTTHGLPAKVIAGFVDEAVNRLLDLDTQREVALALLPIGRTPAAEAGPAPNAPSLGLKTVPISDDEIEFPPILEMHAASSLAEASQATAWRVGMEDGGWKMEDGDKSIYPLSSTLHPLTMPAPSGQLFSLQPYSEGEMSQEPIESVIIRRGSTRRFAREPITFRQLSTLLHRAMQPIPADFLPPGARLNQAYLIVNAVEGLEAGAYLFHPDRQALELLKKGDFRGEAGYLGLNQALPADASLNIFFLTDLNPVLERLGNRGYRVAQLEASIIAGRIYLAAYAQRLGATGLTFFDDAVTAFFSPHAQDQSVMFLIAVGKRARRRR